MGTNYYLHIGDEEETCPHCGQATNEVPEPIHIGKSSAGWRFSLHVYPNGSAPYPKHLEDWIHQFNREDTRIVDEYGRPISPEDMVRKIKDRQGNREEPLMRHPVRYGCLGNAEDGDYDLMTGDFS